MQTLWTSAENEKPAFNGHSYNDAVTNGNEIQILSGQFDSSDP